MGGSGYLANLQDPRYAAADSYTAPNGIDPQLLTEPSPARTGVIWGSLFREPTCYTRFTGGLDQLAEDGSTLHPLSPFELPYQQAWTRPAMAGPQGFRPKMSAFVNKALGAANADRTPATRVTGPTQPERSFAVPISAFWDQFPRGTVPPFNRQPGYVTRWPAAQMTFTEMGPGGAQT